MLWRNWSPHLTSIPFVNKDRRSHLFYHPGAYSWNYSVASYQKFDLNASYPRGTLLGRPYYGVHDQAHPLQCHVVDLGRQ